MSLLSRREKQRGLGLLLLVIVMAALETAGVASVMPFLAVLGNPGLVESNPHLSRAYTASGAPNVTRFLVYLGIASFAVVMISALFRAGANYAMNNYIEQRRHSIGMRLLATYLRQPYEFFLNQHSANLSKSILSEADQLTQNIYRPLIQLVAFGVVLMAMVVFLLVVDYQMAIVSAAVIGGAYSLVYLAVKSALNRIGRDRLRANTERFTTAAEALGGIKDIKLRGHESSYLSRFEAPSADYAKYQAANITIAMLPKFLIEAVGFGGMLLLAVLLLIQQGGARGDSLGHVLPLLGIYVFAAYRMLPAAQNIYGSLANIRFGAAALNSVYADVQLGGASPDTVENAEGPVLAPRHSIRLDAVSYSYPGASRRALREITIEIPAGSRIGLVGTTGSGKTTLADLLLGLLRPASGSIQVDGVDIDDRNLRAWQQALGYVPQSIFLTDATVAENIAFGVQRGLIDRDRVEQAARMADVHDFVMSTMPAGFDTQVGERGVRLSGGQRQRIGIARALYHRPSVLVLDEATSALDNRTEQDVLQAVLSLDRSSTVVMIAHRLSTVRNCDCIYMLEDGAVSAQGSYEQLIEMSAAFRHMAMLESKDADVGAAAETAP
jgi:ABC-type multidrug transport system fused ATPase/permease subunit